ncbi:MAG: hypothetical protein WAX38_01945 [Minisyncoccia bacterium]
MSKFLPATVTSWNGTYGFVNVLLDGVTRTAKIGLNACRGNDYVRPGDKVTVNVVKKPRKGYIAATWQVSKSHSHSASFR